jgi:hypothetical protein
VGVAGVSHEVLEKRTRFSLSQVRTKTWRDLDECLITYARKKSCNFFPYTVFLVKYGLASIFFNRSRAQFSSETCSWKWVQMRVCS